MSDCLVKILLSSNKKNLSIEWDGYEKHRYTKQGTVRDVINEVEQTKCDFASDVLCSDLSVYI